MWATIPMFLMSSIFTMATVALASALLHPMRSYSPCRVHRRLVMDEQESYL
jgi:hypothetical protein